MRIRIDIELPGSSRDAAVAAHVADILQRRVQLIQSMSEVNAGHLYAFLDPDCATATKVGSLLLFDDPVFPLSLSSDAAVAADGRA